MQDVVDTWIIYKFSKTYMILVYSGLMVLKHNFPSDDVIKEAKGSKVGPVVLAV